MNEFFVGYIPKVPPGIARLIGRSVVVLFFVATLLAIVLVSSQRRFPAAFFEFTHERDLVGVIEERPYPALLVDRPGTVGDQADYSRYLLVALGKHGAEAQIAGLDGKRVTMKGKLIYRGSDTLVEVMPNSVSIVGKGTEPRPATDLGQVTLTGEIVDTKCYLGVMNPGAGKVHRDCATRCLSGGIPPALVVHERNGTQKLYVLANLDGQRIPADWVAARAGRPVTVSGRLLKSGDTMILQADLSSVQVAGMVRRDTLK